MSAPLLWSVIPLGFGALLLMISRFRKIAAGLAFLLCLLLILVAVFVPINSMIIFGTNSSLIFTDSMLILGRTLKLERSMQPLLVFFYLLGGGWILSSLAVKVHRFFAPLVLMETGLIIGMIAVSPFIYGAFFVQLCVLIALPLFWIQKRDAGDGIVRFLLYHLLGMVFLALGGWLADAVDINPSDLFLVRRAVTVILIGFIFWLAVFPFHTWLAILMDESCPYIVGFTVSLLQFSTLFILLNFLNTYEWMRAYTPLFAIFRLIGVIMLFVGGVWCFFQQSVQRMIAYLFVAENGIALLLLGFQTQDALTILLTLLFIREIAFLVWSLAIKSLGEQASFQFADLTGLQRRRPMVAGALIVSYFSIAGLHFFAAFPLKTTLMQFSFAQSPALGAVVSIGCWLLIIAGFRLVRCLMRQTPLAQETDMPTTNGQMLALGLGIFVLLLIPYLPKGLNELILQIQSRFLFISGG